MQDELVLGDGALQLEALHSCLSQSVPFFGTSMPRCRYVRSVATRRASRAKGDLTRGRRFDRDFEDAGGPVHDLLQRLRLEEVEVVDRAEAIAERRGETADARRRAHKREAR